MAEPKKKSPRKAAATRKAAPKRASPKKDSKVNTETPARPDEDARDAVLAAALPDAAFDGFSEGLLAKAGKAAGLETAEIARLFPEGPLSLIEHYSTSVDAAMETKLAQMDLPSLRIRARIAAAVTMRLALLKPHKEAARRAAALLTLPMHASLGAKLMYRTVDVMWRAAGDTDTDFNFYTKRGILAGVYGSTLVRWFNDESEDEKTTQDFLAARIENVMQFEKFKAKAKTALAAFPAFANWGKAP